MAVVINKGVLSSSLLIRQRICRCSDSIQVQNKSRVHKSRVLLMMMKRRRTASAPSARPGAYLKQAREAKHTTKALPETESVSANMKLRRARDCSYRLLADSLKNNVVTLSAVTRHHVTFLQGSVR